MSELPLLLSGAHDLGFDLSPRQIEQFRLYYETLVDWNSRMNLTAITDPEGVQTRHFLDSLTVGAALVRELGSAPPEGFRLIDVGTGAGFPGVPLKILWPKVRLALADSVGKKTTFLRELCQVLGLGEVEIHTGRAEELGLDTTHRQQYDAVTARGVAPLPVLCEYCLPLVKVGGVMLAPKKGDISQELLIGKRAAFVLGGGPPDTQTFRLPGEDEDRFVVVVTKLRNTPAAYPRRVGVAKAKPLGT
ncbi:MAG TPA: 16S rRNA (guanine(527)-N(7))-methyltransferase RsmG [Chloroflexia bacterium]|nr:16S rRNA (guanine(527)-N(7))-methyltransferase RsmG [Chloroflexia bacterium]